MNKVTLKLALGFFLMSTSIFYIINAWKHVLVSEVINESIAFILGYQLGKGLPDYLLLAIGITFIYQAVQLMKNRQVSGS